MKAELQHREPQQADPIQSKGKRSKLGFVDNRPQVVSQMKLIKSIQRKEAKTAPIQLELGGIGKLLKENSFSESDYLDEDNMILGCYLSEPFPKLQQYGLFTEEEGKMSYEEFVAQFKSLKKEDKDDIFKSLRAGACGDLANYFLEYAKYSEASEENPIDGVSLVKDTDINKLKDIVNSPQDRMIRLYIPWLRHEVTLITHGDNIEIIQSWLGVYSVTEWLDKNNKFSKEEFLEKLKNIKQGNNLNTLFNVRMDAIVQTVDTNKISSLMWNDIDITEKKTELDEKIFGKRMGNMANWLAEMGVVI